MSYGTNKSKVCIKSKHLCNQYKIICVHTMKMAQSLDFLPKLDTRMFKNSPERGRTTFTCKSQFTDMNLLNWWWGLNDLGIPGRFIHMRLTGFSLLEFKLQPQGSSHFLQNRSQNGFHSLVHLLALLSCFVSLWMIEKGKYQGIVCTILTVNYIHENSYI